MNTEPTDRARSYLRGLDRETQRADEEASAALRSHRDADRRREAALDIFRRAFRHGSTADAERVRAAYAARDPEELAARYAAAHEDGERDYRERLARVRGCQAEYQGARNMAVELGVLPSDECPRWQP